MTNNNVGFCLKIVLFSNILQVIW